MAEERVFEDERIEDSEEEEISPERRAVAVKLFFFMAILAVAMAGLLAVEIIERFFVGVS